jgi:hypothetical protein
MNIYKKLIEVRKVVKYLKKENEGAQYKYVSSSQTLAAVKEKLDELELLLVPSVTNKTIHKDVYEKTFKGETKRAVDYFTELEMDFTWVNAEKPEETILCHWYGQGLDTGEKGVGKALTYADKYFMLKFFNIPTDKDDPDSFQEKLDNKNNDNKTAGKTVTPKPDAAKVKDTSGLASTEQIKRMYTMVTKAKVDEAKFREWLYKKYEITTSKELTKNQIDEVFNALDEKIAKLAAVQPAGDEPPEDYKGDGSEGAAIDNGFGEWVKSENLKEKERSKVA